MSGVERRRVAPGLSVSRVITGLWQIADMERHGDVDRTAAARAMEPYVEAGLTTFDMADHYGSAEEICGEFVRVHGADGVELLTKWVPEPGPTSRDDVRAAVGRSLERLGVDALDLLQFHAWSYADPRYLDSLAYLQELRDEGLIRHLGVTNVDAAHLAMLRHTGLDVVSNQVCFSLLDQRARRGEMLDVCDEHGVTLLAFGTVAGGLLTERWLGEPDPGQEGLSTWSQRKYRRFVREAGGWEALQGLLRVVQDVAARHGVSMANVACRHVLEQRSVGAVIVGARLGESEHRDDNLRLLELELDDEDRARLDAAVEALRPIPGDCGDEYRRPPYLTAAGDLSDHLEELPAPYDVRDGEDGRGRVLSGTVWEDLAGFSRAVRRGDRILVSGTTATHGDRVIGGSDPAAQLEFVIDKIEGALQSLGAGLEHVVRTRLYIDDLRDWEAVSRVHGRRFAAVRPANTLIEAGVIGDEYRVEMEAEALVDEEGG